MKVWATVALAAVVGLGAGTAQAQVSDDDYGRFFDFMTSPETWVCNTSMPVDWIDGGELDSQIELNFQKSYSGDYRFTGTGKETITVDNHDYVQTFNFEGFGFNDSSFGTGVSITSVDQTSGDPGWTWHKNENIQLHLEETTTNTYKLTGYQLRDDGQINYDCGS